MSLYIGNLSNHISREDLEHVFRKFGRCRIQMKDGFGFAVYDFRSNAERALRELRGRNICGESVTLTWSNRQPKPYQKFGRANSFHDSRRGRNAYGEDSGRRGVDLSHRDGRTRVNRFQSVVDGHNSAEGFDEEKVHLAEDIQSSSRDLSRHSVEDFVVDPDSIEPGLADSGRWGETAHMLPDLNGPAPADGAEFDRYDPYHDFEGNDDNDSFPINCEGGSESVGISQNDAGYERSSMNPLPDPMLQGKDSGNANHDHYEDDKPKSRDSLERTRPKSRESSCSVRGTSCTSRQSSDGNGPVSTERQNVPSSGTPPCPEGSDASRKNSGGRKRQSCSGKSGAKMEQPQKRKRSVSSALHGQSPDGLHSSFSYSMSGSVSDHSKNRSQKSHSRSRSFTSLSLSDSQDQPLASSPNKTCLNQDNSIGNATPSSQEDPSEHDESLKSGRITELENTGCDASTVMAIDETGLTVAEQSACIDHDHSVLADGIDAVAVALSSDRMKISSCSSMVENLAATQNITCENLQGGLENNEVLLKEHVAAPGESVQVSILNSSNSAMHSSMLSEEIFMALSRYGLEVPEENESHIPAGEFFGSARMWPWPVIYYRRLRKGPISVDNYARRVLQNKEFGITDKFVRSSSGWGELSEPTD